MPNRADIIDCRGLRCPLPVLKLEKRLPGLRPGESLVVLATDPMAKLDVPLACHRQGVTCTMTESDGVFSFAVSRP